MQYKLKSWERLLTEYTPYSNGIEGPIDRLPVTMYEELKDKVFCSDYTIIEGVHRLWSIYPWMCEPIFDFDSIYEGSKNVR